MANIKSAKKRIKVIETKTMRNKAIRSKVKTMIKKVDAAIEAKDKAAAEAARIAAEEEAARIAEEEAARAAAEEEARGVRSLRQTHKGVLPVDIIAHRPRMVRRVPVDEVL